MHDYQYEAVRTLLAGNDVFVVAGTGMGKSLIPQFVALAFCGVAFVVTPFVAIVQDQVAHLARIGIPAYAAPHAPNDLEIGAVYCTPGH